MIQIQNDSFSQSGATASDSTAADNTSNNFTSDGNTDNSNADNSSTNNAAEIDRLLAELDRLVKETESKSAESTSAEKPVTAQENSAEPAAEPTEPTTESATEPTEPTMESATEPATEPVAQESATEPTEQSIPTQPEETDQSAAVSETTQSGAAQSAVDDTLAGKTTDEFDFNSFLADLESKIDKENEQKTADNASEPVTSASEPTDNEPEPADNEQEPTDNEPENEELADDFRKNHSAIDIQTEERQSTEDSNEDSTEGSVGDSTTKDREANEQKNSNDEELKTQNIFEMLGLMHIADAEKDKFLDELETVIWDDFVMHDLELVLTSVEYADARRILDAEDKKADEKKEELIIYLEKILPDLDEILYDKALELKSEMMGERLSQMKKNADEATLAKIKEVEDLISQNKWKSASLLLNQLS